MTRETMMLPAKTQRLFAHYGEIERLLEQYPEFVIGRILEEGDSEDLRWLFGCVGPSEIRAWLETRGARQLSHRSCCFWSLVVGRSNPGPPKLTGQVWPL